MLANLENSAVATGLEKVSFHSNPKEQQCQRMFKLSYNCTHFTYQKYKGNAQNPSRQASAICELRNSRYRAVFRKSRKTRVQIANIHWITEKAREFQRNIYFCFIDYTKSLTVWITTNCRKFLKRWEYQTTLPAS